MDNHAKTLKLNENDQYKNDNDNNRTCLLLDDIEYDKEDVKRLSMKIKPLISGLYLCSIEQLITDSMNKENEHFLADLNVHYMIVLYYDYKQMANMNKSILSVLIDDDFLLNRLSARNKIKRLVMKIKADNNSDGNENGLLFENNCFECLMKFKELIQYLILNKQRIMITFVEEQIDLIALFVTFSLSKLLSMSLTATFDHIKRCLVKDHNYNAPLLLPKLSSISDEANSLNDYQLIKLKLIDYLNRLNMIDADVEINCLERHNKFCQFTRENRFDNLTLQSNRGELLTLLRQYLDMTKYIDINNNDGDNHRKLLITKLLSTYLCGQCSYELFTDENIIEQSKVLSFSNDQYESSKCPSIFIEPMRWMCQPISEHNQKPSLCDRTIYCPQCNHVIGHYRLNGMNCKNIILNNICSQHPTKQTRIFKIHSRMIAVRRSPYLPLILYRIWCLFCPQKCSTFNHKNMSKYADNKIQYLQQSFNLTTLSSNMSLFSKHHYQKQIISNNNKESSTKLAECLSMIKQSMINQVIKRQQSNNQMDSDKNNKTDSQKLITDSIADQQTKTSVNLSKISVENQQKKQLNLSIEKEITNHNESINISTTKNNGNSEEVIANHITPNESMNDQCSPQLSPIESLDSSKHSETVGNNVEESSIVNKRKENVKTLPKSPSKSLTEIDEKHENRKLSDMNQLDKNLSLKRLKNSNDSSTVINKRRKGSHASNNDSNKCCISSKSSLNFNVNGHTNDWNDGSKLMMCKSTNFEKKKSINYRIPKKKSDETSLPSCSSESINQSSSVNDNHRSLNNYRDGSNLINYGHNYRHHRGYNHTHPAYYHSNRVHNNNKSRVDNKRLHQSPSKSSSQVCRNNYQRRLNGPSKTSGSVISSLKNRDHQT